jgi:hypothetical protein
VKHLLPCVAILVAMSALADPADDGKKAFVDVARVLQSPRCQNCHPNGDRPRIGDNGKSHHAEVRRGLERVGMSCQTCHRTTSTSASRQVGGPPAVKNWHLPPEEHPMVFEGKTVTQLCEQLKDPAQNGGKDAAALLQHVSHDDLVLYGWNPGGKRTLPPLSHEKFVAQFSTWTQAGMPCP